MAKLTKEELLNKYTEKITDNDDLLIGLMEDITDSIEPGETVDVEAIQKELNEAIQELETTKAELADLKERYKQRFLGGETPKEEPIEEPIEENVIDVKEI